MSDGDTKTWLDEEEDEMDAVVIRKNDGGSEEEKQLEKQLKTDDDKKEISIVPFELEKQHCDVVLKTSDDDVLLSSKSLRFISEHLSFAAHHDDDDDDINGGLFHTRDEDEVTSTGHLQKVINCEEFSSANTVKALSYYHPRYFTEVNDHSDFYQLLSLCERWDLKSFKDHIENFILTKHDIQLSAFDGLLRLKHIAILRLADEFKLRKVLNSVMSRIKKVDFQYGDSSTIFGFEHLTRELKYEILKVIMKGYVKSPSTQGLSMTMELHSIFNFMDFLLYEDRVVDRFPKSKVNQYSPPKYAIYDQLNREEFTVKRPSADVTLIVDGVEIFVNSFVLTENSPVFKKMVQQSKEGDGDGKVIKIPYKSLDEMILLLTVLTRPIDINEDVDVYTLACLCMEYRIDWVVQRIKLHIETKSFVFASQPSKEILKHLKLSSLLKFVEAEQNLLNQIDEPFIILETYEEFTWLNPRVKLSIARKRLATLMSNLSSVTGKERDLLLNTNGFGLISVFEHHQQQPINFEQSLRLKKLEKELSFLRTDTNGIKNSVGDDDNDVEPKLFNFGMSSPPKDESGPWKPNNTPKDPRFREWKLLKFTTLRS